MLLGRPSKAAKGTYRTAIDSNLPHGFNISAPTSPPAYSRSSMTPAVVHRHVGIAN